MSTLSKKLNELIETKSDINEHLITIMEHARECKHITEFGVRTGLSSIALLAGVDESSEVISFDIVKHPEIDQIGQRVKEDKKKRTFIKHDTRDIVIDPTDMLFIDTLHNYMQLKTELHNNHSRVRKYIAMHDTTTFGVHGETPGTGGLRYAVEEFLLNHPEWEIKYKFTNNNGLTILERVSDVDTTPTDHKPIMCVYTAIYGDQDVLKLQPQQSVDCDYVCFTDNPDLECEIGARKQWKIIVTQPFRHLHPRMQAKYYRTHPDLVGNYPYKMWVDGTTKFKKRDTVEYLLSQFLPKSDILCYKHDNRDCIYDEATYSQQFEKYKGLPMQAQVKHYKSEGMPEHYGLTGTGLLITRGGNYEPIKEMLHGRWTECLTRTYQDQLSFDYLVWLSGLKRQWIKEGQFFNNPYVFFTGKHKHEK